MSPFDYGDSVRELFRSKLLALFSVLESSLTLYFTPHFIDSIWIFQSSSLTERFPWYVIYGSLLILLSRKAYLSQTQAQQPLVRQVFHLIIKLCKRMRSRLLGLSDKFLSRKRVITDQLKNIWQIELSRHHSLIKFLANLVADLITYWHWPIKASLGLQFFSPSQA